MLHSFCYNIILTSPFLSSINQTLCCYYICRTVATSNVTFSKKSVDHYIKNKKVQQNMTRDVAPVAKKPKTNVSKSISKKSVFDRSCNVAHRRRSTHCRKLSPLRALKLDCRPAVRR